MIIKNILRFILVAVLQVLIFNNIQFSGYINPNFYILFILLLPIKTPAWLTMTSAFLLGSIIDIFSQSPGLHASASVLIAFVRPFIISLIKTNSEIKPDSTPNISNMGFRWFITYSAMLIFLHHTIYFFLEIFRTTHFMDTFYHIILSSLATFIIIILSQLFIYKKNQH